MTSIEIPYSIAAALPTLIVVDVTNHVRRAVRDGDLENGIVFVWAGDEGIVRVNEREAGFFDDVERMLERLVPQTVADERVRMLSFLLGPRTEQVPFARRRLCLGRWQRILVFSFSGQAPANWEVTLVG
jgi:thiamine phosphate synthase YjbQ (UPF0047 family)